MFPDFTYLRASLQMTFLLTTLVSYKFIHPNIIGVDHHVLV